MYQPRVFFFNLVPRRGGVLIVICKIQERTNIFFVPKKKKKKDTKKTKVYVGALFRLEATTTFSCFLLQTALENLEGLPSRLSKSKFYVGLLKVGEIVNRRIGS